MFIKVTKSGPRRYVQLVEAYRDDTGRPKQRTVATLGRLDQLGDSIKSMHEGLSRILGVDGASAAGSGTPQFESSRALGDVWVLTQIWKQLGLDRLRQVLKQRTRHRIDLEALLRVMVINRLCDADSKLGTLRWLKTVSLPDTSLESVNHQQLLRTMDALLEHQDVIDKILADAVRPLVSEDLSVVFYDMTTIRAEGLSEADEEIRQFGKSKEGGLARQFMLGLVQTAEGIPLYHEVFPGNTAEVGTLKSSLLKVLERFPIKRVIAVADRGLLSLDNLETLQKSCCHRAHRWNLFWRYQAAVTTNLPICWHHLISVRKPLTNPRSWVRNSGTTCGWSSRTTGTEPLSKPRNVMPPSPNWKPKRHSG